MTITTAAIVLGLCVAGTVLLIVSATKMFSIRDRVALRWYHVLTRLLSVALLGIISLFMAPRVKALLISFDLNLPYLGMPVFKLGDIAFTFFPHLLLFCIVAVTLEMLFFDRCLRRDEDEQVEFARLCSFLVTSTLVLTLLICEVGIAVSLIKLANALGP